VQRLEFAFRPPDDPQVVPAGDRGKLATLARENHGSLRELLGQSAGAMGNAPGEPSEGDLST
jgi:hypothetical protein